MNSKPKEYSEKLIVCAEMIEELVKKGQKSMVLTTDDDRKIVVHMYFEDDIEKG